ncbi:MAG: hypothetical protein N4A65_08550 [Cohaesibacter sp.]|jgi:hypothetical protein|nr:hypothetical protein [Cohaesibacter sp.]
MDDKPASFGTFASSLLPLMLLVAVALVGFHFTSNEMPLIGALLLTLLSAIPLSIGPLFLMLVSYGLGKGEAMYPLAVAFNRLRFWLVLPIFALVMAAMANLLPLKVSPLLAALGGAYFLVCLWFVQRLVARYLPLSTLMGYLTALGAMCLAIL